jgi:hypothetical protein
MTEVQGAMLTLEDVVNVNKPSDPLEAENFFILMEVYGATPEISTYLMKAYDQQASRQ